MFVRGKARSSGEHRPSSKARRWSFAGVLCAVLLVAAIGCGSPDSKSSGQKHKPSGNGSAPLKDVRVAYKTTASAKTAKVDLVETVSGLQGQDVRITGSGVTDFADKTSRFTMNLPQMGDFEVRQVGGKIYEKFPEVLRAQMPGKKTWVVIDLDKLYSEQYGTSFSGMQGAASDPTSQLQYLRGVSDSVKKVGEEKVRGVPTTHYKATLDLKKSIKEQGGNLKQAYKKLESQLGTSKLPTDVWLDGKGRVRRYEMEMPLPSTKGATSPQGGSTGKQAGISIVEEVYDFGTPVNVSPSPPNQTMDMSELMPGKKT